MQRFILSTCLTAFLMASSTFAQQMEEDVVHLNNGGLIRGTIIEQIPGGSLTIQTRDGNVLVFRMDEIARISKEPVVRMRGRIYEKKKEPWVAFALSFLIPGAGQVYNGEVGKGAAQFGGTIVGWGLVISATEDNSLVSSSDPDGDDGKILPGCFLCWAALYGHGLMHPCLQTESIGKVRNLPTDI